MIEESNYKRNLQKILQSWANKNTLHINFDVVNASKDTAQIIIRPAKGTLYNNGGILY